MKPFGQYPDEKEPPKAVASLLEQVDRDGGRVLAVYREPVGGNWQAFCLLPLEKVAPTPYQRDLSPTHAKRLTDVVRKIGRFVDPIVVVSPKPGVYWTPNGHHRRTALEKLKAEMVPAILIPEAGVAFQILALNTEKAHNLREKSLEVIRMARSLAQLDPRPEEEFALEFEEAAFLTLGAAYEKRGRFSGGAYHPVLRRVDGFLAPPLPRALEVRETRAAKLLELDDAVSEAVGALKQRGFESPYLKAFVVARVNPVRFQKGAAPPAFDGTLEKMLAAARKFDPERIRAEHLAGAAGPPEE
jgi:ParB family chromosome partitioning protein